jgi:hypothetical protein
MNYFVIAADGQKYGPADIPTLNHWAQEGRVLVTSMLEDAATGAQVPATSVSGIIFPQGSGAPSINASYQQSAGFVNDNGVDDVKKVWLFGGLAFIPCCFILPIIFGILAIVYASTAQKKGNPQGTTAMTFAIVSLIGGLLFSFVIRAVGYAIIRGISH